MYVVLDIGNSGFRNADGKLFLSGTSLAVSPMAKTNHGSLAVGQ
jgi:hypothetical protein